MDTSETAAVEPAVPPGRAGRGRAGGGLAIKVPPSARHRVVALLPVLRGVGFVGAVALVVWMAIHAVQEVDLRRLSWGLLVPALAATLVWWVLLARGWALLVTGRSRRADVSLWCRTQTLRYLPGGIWAPASRVASVHGKSVDRLGTVAAENVIALCAALAVAGIGLTASGRPWYLPLALALAVPILAARMAGGRTRVRPARALRATWNYLAAFVAYSVAVVLVQAAVSGFDDPLAVAGAAGLSWAIGLVVIIAPGGVGVREVVYVALLSGVAGRSDLTAAAVTMRLVTIAAELAVLLVAGRPAAAERAPAEAGVQSG